MYLVVRNYKIQGDKKEISSKIDREFVPLISKIKGFVDYYCLYHGDNSLLSVSVFQDEKGANDSVSAAADWVAKNLAKYFPEKPQVFSGEVFAHGRGQEQEIRKAA